MRPILFESPYFILFAYPLFMGMAWGIAYYLSRFLLEKNKLNSKPLLPLFLSVFLSSWIGAKLFFLAFSAQDNFDRYLYADNFWLGGGFVFYGGLIFGLVTFLIFSLVIKKFPFNQSKFLAPGLAFGHAIGRMGCFLTGCCYGSQCELFWSVHMHGEFRHPVQLYEVFGLTILGLLCLAWLRKNKDSRFVITRYLMFYSVLRFIIEFFRGDIIRGLYWYQLSSSQLVSLFLFVVAFSVAFLLPQSKRHYL